jgi:hypothetical protein
MTDHTAVSISAIYQSAKDALGLGDYATSIKAILKNMPDLTAAFGADAYGSKVIPNIKAAAQQGHDLLSGVIDMVTNGSHNLLVTGQSFQKSEETNQDLIPRDHIPPRVF